MTYDEFDAMMLTVREAEHESLGGFRRVWVSPATYEAIRVFWSWAGPVPPAQYASSPVLMDTQVAVER